MGRVYEGDATAPCHSCSEVLDELSQVSNLLVDPLGHPILGRNLVEDTPVKIASADKLDCEQQLNRILMDFYFLVDEVHIRIPEACWHLTTTSTDAFWEPHNFPTRNLVW